MKTSSCPNLNRETTSFPNFFTLFQDPDRHDNDTTTLNKRPKTDRGDDTSTLNKRPKIYRGDDTEASEASSFKDALSSFVSFDEMNEPGYLPNCWDQEDDQTLAKWPPSPNGSAVSASVGSNQLNPENFGAVKAKHSLEEARQRWRRVVGLVPKRRFRFTANLSNRYEAAAMRHRQSDQEKLRVAVLVSKVAMQFVKGVQPSDYVVPQEVKAAGFDICGDELGSLVEGHDPKKLEYHGGVAGIADTLSTLRVIVSTEPLDNNRS